MRTGSMRANTGGSVPTSRTAFLRLYGQAYNPFDVSKPRIRGCRRALSVRRSQNVLGGALLDWKTSAAGDAIRGGHKDRLDSWKRIAAYLKCDVSTVQRTAKC